MSEAYSSVQRNPLDAYQISQTPLYYKYEFADINKVNTSSKPVEIKSVKISNLKIAGVFLCYIQIFLYCRGTIL